MTNHKAYKKQIQSLKSDEWFLSRFHLNISSTDITCGLCSPEIALISLEYELNFISHKRSERTKPNMLQTNDVKVEQSSVQSII